MTSEIAISTGAIQKVHDVKWQSTPFVRKTDSGIKKPLKLLCLHGGGSNNDITRMQLANVGLSQKAELDLIHGKHKSKPIWPTFHRLSKPFWGWLDKKTSTPMYKVLMSLAKTIEREGPYHGLYGFSQGSFFALLLSSHDIAEAFEIKPNWSFVIIAVGYFGLRSIKEVIQQYGKAAKMPLENSIEIPSLHLVGRYDSGLANSLKQDKMYKSASVVYHDYGHGLFKALLKDASFQAAVFSFMNQQTISKL